MGSANVVAFGSGIVRQKIFAVFLGPAGYGVYGVLASLFDLLRTITIFGVPTGLLKEASAAIRDGNPSAVAHMLRTVRIALVGVALVVCVVTALLSPSLATRFGVPAWWIVVMCLGLPAVALTGTSEAIINALGHIPRLALSKVLTTLTGLVPMVVLVSLFGLFGAVVQLVTGALLGAIMSFALLRGPLRAAVSGSRSESAGRRSVKSVGNPTARQLLKAVFAVGLAQSIVHAGITVNLFAFRSLILVDLGDVQGGFYQGAMGLSRQYTAAFTAALFVHVYPTLGRLVADQDAFRAEVNRALRFVFGLTVPVALLLLAARDVLVSLVFSDEFLEMIPLMAWTLPADVLAIAMGLLRMAVLSSADNRGFVVLGIGFEVVYAFCFVVGLQAFGLQGAVAAYAIASVVGMLLFGGYLTRMGLVRVAGDVWLRLGVACVLLTSASLLPLSPLTRVSLVLAAACWLVAERNELRRAFS